MKSMKLIEKKMIEVRLKSIVYKPYLANAICNKTDENKNKYRYQQPAQKQRSALCMIAKAGTV